MVNNNWHRNIIIIIMMKLSVCVCLYIKLRSGTPKKNIHKLYPSLFLAHSFLIRINIIFICVYYIKLKATIKDEGWSQTWIYFNILRFSFFVFIFLLRLLALYACVGYYNNVVVWQKKWLTRTHKCVNIYLLSCVCRRVDFFGGHKKETGIHASILRARAWSHFKSGY